MDLNYNSFVNDGGSIKIKIKTKEIKMIKAAIKLKNFKVVMKKS